MRPPYSILEGFRPLYPLPYLGTPVTLGIAGHAPYARSGWRRPWALALPSHRRPAVIFKKN